MARQGYEVQSNGIALQRKASEGPRIVQKCDEKAMHSNDAQWKSGTRQGSATLSIGTAQQCGDKQRLSLAAHSNGKA